MNLIISIVQTLNFISKMPPFGPSNQNQIPHLHTGTKFKEIANKITSYLPCSVFSFSDKELAIKKERLQHVLSGISQHFKRLRVCWDKAIVSAYKL